MITNASNCSIWSFAFATILCVLAPWGTQVTRAQPPATDSAADVAHLIKKLESPTRAERETAERKLLERGPGLLPILPATSPQPAVQAALARVRRQLEQQQGIALVQEPTRFDVTGSGSLSQVLSASDATALPRLNLTPAQASRKVEIDAIGSSYWALIDQIAEQASLWPSSWDVTHGLAWRDQTPEDKLRRIGYAGVFRVAAGPIERRILDQEKKQFLYRIPLELRAEPRVRPLFLRLIAKDATVTASDETTLAPFTPDATYEIPIGKTGGIANHQLDFVGGDITGPLLMTIQLRATLAAMTEKFEFPIERTSFERAAKQQGAVHVELRQRQWPTADTLKIEIGVRYASEITAFDSYRTWVYHNDAAITVAHENGEITTISPEPAFETIAETPGALRLRYSFKNIPPTASAIHFSYTAPTQVVETPLEAIIPGLELEASSRAALEATPAAR